MNDYILGIDLGTSSVKTALFVLGDFRLIGLAAEEYPVRHPRPGFAEQDPEMWWEAVVRSLHALLADRDAHRIAAIGLTGQMHGLVCLGQDLSPIHPAIIWADTRSADLIGELAKLQRSCKGTLPGPPAAGFAASSALWLSLNESDSLESTRTILAPKDYIRFRLTGDIATDPSDASATWLYDMAASDWSPEVADFCGLQPDQLPPIKPTSSVAGKVSSAAAGLTGLVDGTPVITGSADLAAQATGHGILHPGDVLVTVGTGGQVVSARRSPDPDPTNRYYVFHHSAPEKWYAQAAILSAGMSLRWLRDLFGWTTRPDAYKKLSRLAAEAPAGAEGLIFLPYLVGERVPHMDPDATGMFLGLRLHHQAAHLARAVMEGVGFALKDCLFLIDVQEPHLVLSGGAAASTVWPQILADIWELTVLTSQRHLPYASLGAAVLADPAFQSGGKPLRPFQAARRHTKKFRPGEDSERYRSLYTLYTGLYDKLKEDMHLLSQTGNGSNG